MVFLVYLIAEIYYIGRYRKLLLENFTDKSTFKNYNWLKHFAILLFVGQSLISGKGYSRANLSIESKNSLRTIVLVLYVGYF